MATSKSQGTDRTFQFSDPAAIVIIGLIAVVLAAIVWYFAHKEISAVYVYARYVQLWLVNFIGAFVELPGISAAHGWVQRMCAPESSILLCQRDFSAVSWSEISDSSLVFNALFLVILMVWCFRMFLVVDRQHPTFRFAKNHSLESFAKENIPLYPHLKVFTALDLVSKPLDDPRFGMSRTSRQFAYHHRLISGWQEMPDGQYVPGLDRGKAAAVLLKQLGKHWTRSADLTPTETLLLAIALPRVAATDPQMSDSAFQQALADSDGLVKWCWDHFNPPAKPKGVSKGRKLANQVSEEPYTWLTPSFDLTHPRKIIARYIQHPIVAGIIAHHAYRRTVLYACYIYAGKLGVFPPADVRWMRFYDRELWYLRSSIGRQVAFAEGGAAVYSHYLYEVRAGYAIVEPQIDKAINGLETAMHAFKYTKADKLAYEAKPDK